MSSADYRAVFAGLPGLFVVVTPDLRIVDASDAYLQATKRTRDIIGLSLVDLASRKEGAQHDENVARLGASIGRAVAAKTPDRMPTMPVEMRRPDGTIEQRYWTAINAPVVGPDGAVQHVIHHVSDATPEVLHRQMTEALEAQKAALERANAEATSAREAAERSTRAKSDFLSQMSHELRTPLNSIIGFSELLLDARFGALTDKQSRYLGNVHESGKHLLGLINDLLDLSKIEAGRLDVHPEPCSARSIVQNAIATVQPLATEKQLELTFEDAPLPLVTADPVRLKQVVFNLLSNAIKFTPKGGKVVARIENGATPERLRIAISDTGPGIAAADQEQLFRPFHQLANARAVTGTGLGLALTKSLMELMGGAVGVESAVGQGSTFYVECPFLRGAARGGDDRLVLVIDDDRAGRELVEAVLRDAGFRTMLAGSGEQGLALARQTPPDAIVLDIFLPGLDGWDVLRLLQADPATSHVPIVMASVSDDRAKAFGLGAVEHLVKPIDRGLLVEALARHQFSPKLRDRPLRVLVVDDDHAHLELVRSALEPLGYAVTVRDTGRSGLAAAVSGEFDLLLLDLMLPDLSGVEVVHQIRASAAKGLPIVLVTAHDVSGPDHARLRGDVQAILQKGGGGLDHLVDEVRASVGGAP